MLQHRGKAYWKIIIDNLVSSGIGSFPGDRSILKLVDNNSNLQHMVGLGYLSKRTPRFKSMNKINVILDGFFVDIEKLHLHPLIEFFKCWLAIQDLLHFQNAADR